MGTNLFGATNSSLTLTNVQLAEAGAYTVEVANSVGSLIGPQATLTVLPAYAPTWARTAAPSNTWMTVACSADGRKLVAASYGGHIYTSPDFGETWQSNDVPRLSWDSVASSADGTKLVAAAITISGGPVGTILGSTNAGASWYRYTNGLGNSSYSAIASSSDGNNLAVVRYPYVYTSVNSGASWTKSGAPFASWRALDCSADGQKLVVASSVSQQIYTSSNYGGTWNLSSAPGYSWQSVASSANGEKLAAAVFSGPIFLSTNSGGSWSPGGAPSLYWNDIACSTDGKKLVGAVAPGYLYVSTDGGMVWQVTRAPNAEWTSVASSADGTKLVAASWGHIYTWEPTALDLSLSGGNVVISWHTNVPGFILQQRIDLSANEWVNLTNAPTIVGNKYRVILPQSENGNLFRLMYP